MTALRNLTDIIDLLTGLGHDASRPETDALASALWERLPRLRAGLRAATDADGVLRVWLTPAAEAEVAAAFQESPSLGYALHELAARLVTAEVARLVPETAGFGCAPLPARSDCREAACRTGGYGTTTWAVWRGGCETCALATSMGTECPRKRFAG